MLRKTIIALFAVAAVGLVSPSIASAAGRAHGHSVSHARAGGHGGHARGGYGGHARGGYRGGGYDDGYGGGYGGYYGPSYGFGPCLPVPVPIVGCW